MKIEEYPPFILQLPRSDPQKVHFQLLESSETSRGYDQETNTIPIEN